MNDHKARSGTERRELYLNNPTTSRQYYSGIGVETVLGGTDDDNNDYDDDNGDADDGQRSGRNQRVSIVEENLLHDLSIDETSHQSDHINNDSKTGRYKPNNRPVSTPIHSSSFPCKDTNSSLPCPPTEWPQRPLMIRPSPNTSTKIIGIRRVGDSESGSLDGFCAGCILPINNGREERGESLVVDFESTHFVGTMMLRIKQACMNKNVKYNKAKSESYFAGKKRRFQAVVKGRFKTPLPMSQCVTGQTFDRPAGKMPAKFIVNGVIKIMTTLAPQLEANLDSSRPRFLTPLVSTAHTVIVTHSDDTRPKDMEEPIDEPSSVDPSSIMSFVINSDPKSDIARVTDTTNSSIASRMKTRKKVFNTLAAKKSMEPKFDTTKEYTFEFYQHMLDFGEELALDVGGSVWGGKIGLAKVTDGQPLKILAAYRDTVNNDELDSLWNFDLWHESLYPYAKAALEE